VTDGAGLAGNRRSALYLPAVTGVEEVVAIRDEPPNPEYLDAFLQGASFALFALEGRLREDREPSAEVAEIISDLHEMLSATREGLEVREPQTESVSRYIGKN
jgi:hypothetical protein